RHILKLNTCANLGNNSNPALLFSGSLLCVLCRGRFLFFKTVIGSPASITGRLDTVKEGPRKYLGKLRPEKENEAGIIYPKHKQDNGSRRTETGGRIRISEVNTQQGLANGE